MAYGPFSPGGEVDLIGFEGIEASAMSDLQNIIRKRLKRFKEICANFEQLALNLKTVHKQPHSEKYEVHALLKDKAKLYATTTAHKDLLLATEEALEKLESEARKSKA